MARHTRGGPPHGLTRPGQAVPVERRWGPTLVALLTLLAGCGSDGTPLETTPTGAPTSTPVASSVSTVALPPSAPPTSTTVLPPETAMRSVTLGRDFVIDVGETVAVEGTEL